jgi:hypothetical protein
VRGDDRGAGKLYHLVVGLVGDVRDVDHDAQSVHLRDDLPAERAEAVPAALVVVGRVADLVVLGVSERDVADAAIEKVVQVRQVVLDRRAVLHPQRQAHAAVQQGQTDLPELGDQGELVRLPGGNPFDQIDQPVGEVPGTPRFLIGSRCVDRHEGDVQTTFHRAGIVEVTPFGS